jgi:Tfp pilus assembly protein PilF
MSLLLQALQKAAKSREEGEADLTADDLTLADSMPPEPAPSRADQGAPATPTSAQAATVVQASSVPVFDPLDYAREHYMLTIVGAALVFAIGYGTYLYLQLNPYRSSPSAPAPVLPVASQASVASAQRPASAKISGLPKDANPTVINSGQTAAVPTALPAVVPPEKSAAATAISTPEKPSDQTQTTKDTEPAGSKRGAAARSRQRVESPTLADASDSIETVVIPSSRSKPFSEISAQRDTAGTPTINPILLQAYETLQKGDDVRAKGLYEQVLQADPRNMDALLGLGTIALHEGHLDAASRYYQRVLELDPRNSYAQAGLISIFGGADVSASESRLKQLIARDPTAFLYFSLGNLYAEQVQWPSAQQAYFQAFQMQSDNPDYAFNLAVGLEHVGQSRLALDYYRKALDLSFKKGHANFDQSLVIQRVGQLSSRVEQ